MEDVEIGFGCGLADLLPHGLLVIPVIRPGKPQGLHNVDARRKTRRHVFRKRIPPFLVSQKIELRLELIADTAAARSLVAVQVLDFEEDGLNIEYDILSSRNHDAQSPFSVG